MNAETARELFSGAYDGELTSEEREAFETLLAGDEELREDYAEFCDFLKETALLGSGEQALPEIDLLPAVQRKISERSRGRYYRKKTKRDQNQLTLILNIAIIFVFIGIVVWFAMSVFEAPTSQGSQPGESVTDTAGIEPTELQPAESEPAGSEPLP